MATIVEFLLSGFTDNSGEPLASGKVYTYQAGTTTPLAVYTNNLGTVPETNPVILDSNGRKQVYANGSYKFVIKTSADVTLYTFDNLSFGSGAGSTFLGTTTGSSNLYIATPTPAISAYEDGALFTFQAHQTNSGTATLNISSLGAKTISEIAGQIISGFTYIVRYKSSTDTFTIVNPDPGYATTQAEMTALNTAGVPIVVRQSVSLTGNVTLTVPLKIEKGGTIVTNSNILTINGTFEAGYYQCFDVDTDELVFGVGAVDKVLPQWFGAVGDDSTDCAAAINLALNSVKTNGGTVFLANGTYQITEKLIANSNLCFEGNGDSSIIKSAFSLAQGESLIHIEGTKGSNTTLTANVALGSRILTVASTTGFVADEYIYITRIDTYAALHRVKSVDSSTQLTLHEVTTYAWANTETVLRGTWVENVIVKKLRFVGTALASEDTRDRYEDHGVNIFKAHHCTVTDCSFINLGSRAVIAIDMCGECIISNNRAVKCYDRAFEVHVKTSGCVIANNVIEGGLVGIAIHGIGTIAIGNTCKGQYGIDSAGTLRGSGIQAGDLVNGLISGNTILGSQREGMAVGSDVYQTLITGNNIAFTKRDGMTINGNFISITNNIFTDNGNTVEDACIQFSAACNGVHISGNYFKAVNSPTTRAVGSASFAQTNLSIGVNHYSNFGGALTNINSGSTYLGTYIGEGNYIRKYLTATATWDPALVAAGAETNTDITVTGAALGDIVLPPGFSTAFAVPEVLMYATIISANTVRVFLTNLSTSNQDLSSGTVTVVVLKVT